MNILKGLRRIWNMFLDTTPRQWIQYFTFLFNIDYRSWNEFVTDMKLKSKSSSSKSILASSLLHALLLASVGFTHSTLFSEKEQSKDATQLKDRKVKSFESQQMDGEIMEITGVYYFAKTNKREKESQTKFEKLLAKMSRKQTDRWQARKVDPPSKTREVALPVARLSMDKIDWSNINKVQKEGEGDELEKRLNKHLARYDKSFQACYEQALMNDSGLSAKVEFLLEVGADQRISKTNIRFQGVGLPAVKSTLKNCLSTVTKTIRLPEQLNRIHGKQIKFYVVLDSWK